MNGAGTAHIPLHASTFAKDLCMVYTRTWEERRVAYLYGDSTESPLEINYIEFLRDALDFAVEILVADHRIHSLQEDCEERKRSAEVELGQLRQLSDRVSQALDAPPGGPSSSAFRCAMMVRQSSDDAIKRTIGQIKQALNDQLTQVVGQISRERSGNLRALELLLRHRDLPDSTHHVEVVLAGDGRGYTAQVRGKADIGVEWLQSLDIPSSHMFAHLVRVERLSPNLEVRVPEKGGWMRKGMRMRTHRITNKFVTEVIRAAHQTTIKLREAPAEDEAGYNILVTLIEPRVRLVRVEKGGEHSPPFEPVDEDVTKFLEVASQLVDAAEELTESRGPLREARFEGKPIGEHENPSSLVKRLIGKMAPVVQEIARHSLSPDELVLKRVLADDRREEVFAAKADLLAKLDPVPLGLRGVFAPLGLGDLGRPDRGVFGGSGNGRHPRPDTLEPDTTVRPNRPAAILSNATTLVEADRPVPQPIHDSLRATSPALAHTVAAPGRPTQSTPPPTPPSSSRPSPTIPAPIGMGSMGPGMGGTTRPGMGGNAGAGSKPPPFNNVPAPPGFSPGPGLGGSVLPSPAGDEDVTIVAAAAPPARASTAQPEDSNDVALNELENEK